MTLQLMSVLRAKKPPTGPVARVQCASVSLRRIKVWCWAGFFTQRLIYGEHFPEENAC
jgi:hypothetical protein